VANQCAVPSDSSTAVQIPIGSGSSGAARVQQILQKLNSQNPAGGTPTASALNRAYDYFATGDGRLLAGSKWVLLATDGGPNCNAGLTCDAAHCTQNLDCKCGNGCDTTVNCCASSGATSYGYICLDDAATTSAVSKLALLGVKTFVVGLPGSEAYATSLNSFANAGRMPNPNGTNGAVYYAISAATAQLDLIKALTDITTKLVKTCNIALSETPTVPSDKVNVAIDCQLQPALSAGTPADAGNADGFYIDYNQNPAHLMLVGAACDSMMTNGSERIDFITGCPTIN
jgi:hypothetical protein